nr:hypothetical protein [Tanacetum cinerariifolium]
MVKEGIVLGHKVSGFGIELAEYYHSDPPVKRRKFFIDLRHYFWDETFLFKQCADKSYEGAWLEMRQHKFFDNVTTDHLEDIKASPPPQEKSSRPGFTSHISFEMHGDKILLFNLRLRLFPGKWKSRWYGPFSVYKDMKNGAIELYNEDGNGFIVNKQWVKPYQKSVLDTNKDDDITLDDEGEVT